MKAIPTLYRGIQMRSRLEAKWANVFDQLGWRWEYEPIDLEGWIPDFLILCEAEKPLLVEIKPIITTDFGPESLWRKTTLKIERVLGAPIGKNWEAWDSFFETLPYLPLLCGATPVHHSYRAYGSMRYIGWKFIKDFGWFESFPLDESIWTNACNASQWKAPV